MRNSVRYCFSLILFNASCAATQRGNKGPNLGGLDDLGKIFGGADGPFGKSRDICKKNEYIVPRPLERIKKGMLIANGCGPQGMQIKEPYGLWRCCNRHDVCFSSCSTTFAFCEKKFKQCLQKRCKAPENVGREKECQEQANSMTGMTAMFGKGSHDATMLEVCDCAKTSDDALQKRRQWIRDVYRRFGPKDKAEDNEFIDGLLEKSKQKESKEGSLYYELITKYGGSKGFVEFDGIPNTFEIDGPSDVPLSGNSDHIEL